MSSLPEYEVYAVKYAHHERRSSENFLGGDPHDAPMPLDYFVWLIRGTGENAGREIVVDTGFSAPMAAKRQRDHVDRIALPARAPGATAFNGLVEIERHDQSRRAAMPCKALEGGG